jgi:hypothetical protein
MGIGCWRNMGREEMKGRRRQLKIRMTKDKGNPNDE